jgi:hypothetical protein
MPVYDLWVDFNDADNRSRLTSLVRFSTGTPLTKGRLIRIGDDEGNTSLAHVVVNDGDLIEVEMDPTTFRPAGSKPVPVSEDSLAPSGNATGVAR